MRDPDLFQMALGLQAPWQVSKVEFDALNSQLTIMIDFPKGSRFSCPVCGQSDCKAYDSEQKSWRHLNFFQHEAYLTARVPRSDCPRCGPRLVAVPWARPGSGFTLLFEAYVILMAQQHPAGGNFGMISENIQALVRYRLEQADESLHAAFDLRQRSDYGADQAISIGEAQTMAENAKIFVRKFS